MPQFDISSFIVQLVWLFISFLTFYFLFSWLYLPYWAYLLKIRKKLDSLYLVQNINFDNYILENPKSLEKQSANIKNNLYF